MPPVVLLVGLEASSCEKIASVLRETGCAVRIADSSEAAIKLLHAPEPIAHVITDAASPVVDILASLEPVRRPGLRVSILVEGGVLLPV